MGRSRSWLAALCSASLMVAGCNGSGSGPGASAGAATAIPIAAAAGQWTWVDFADAFCGDGSTTGIGINPSPSGSTRVLIFLAPGGACDSLSTCFSSGSAANFTTGYSASTFAAEVANANGEIASRGGPFNRASTTNPFNDYSYVYVPYCTGDVFTGNHLMAYDASHVGHHVGYANMTAFLARIAATFRNADRVILAGSSAGGYGALFNWQQTQQAFGSARVDMLDDSGPLMPPDIDAQSMAAQQALHDQETAWGTLANLPAGCAACATNLDAIWDYYQALYPTHRAGLLSYYNDSTIPTFQQVSAAQFNTGLTQDEADLAGNSSQRYFVVNGTGHVLLFSPNTAQGSSTIQQWLTDFVNDSTAWANVH